MRSRKSKKASSRKSFTQKTKSFLARNFTWTLTVLALSISLTFFLTHTSKTKYQVALTAINLEKLFKESIPLSIDERIAFWSEKLLTDPTVLSPLGNGPLINDTVPLYPHQFDCTTFVETVGALSRSEHSYEINSQLIAIRYHDGKISFQTRNHFPEADWIPNNHSAGIINDLTIQVAHQADTSVLYAHKNIHKLEWMLAHAPKATHRAIASQSMNPVSVKIPYISFKKMKDVLDKIPQGALVNVVRENSKNHPVLISHQGFLIWKNHVAYFRHVNQNHEIEEKPFIDYLHSLSQFRHWKVVGFNIATFNG